jgi:SAM-dependent methyltransferase
MRAVVVRCDDYPQTDDVEPRRSGLALEPRFRLLHSVDLLDGTVLAGDTDCRGAEEALLGGEKFWGLRVIEIAPGSAWLSAHLAARCGAYTVLDRPAATGGKADDVRVGWQRVMQALGLQPAIFADTDHFGAGQPHGYDVAVSFGALSRADNPLELLGRMAELSDDTLVIIEPSEVGDGDDLARARLTMAPETADPYSPRWIFSTALLQRLLSQAGFERQIVTRHIPAGSPETESGVTIVARRPARRPAVPQLQAPPVSETPARAAPKPTYSPDLEAAEDLPLPPPADRRAAAGTADVEVFVTVGRNVFEQMVQALARNGTAAAHLGRVLDFGCGLSRVLRWWRMFPTVEIHGTDIDVAAIMWNRERLGHGIFAFNTLDPKLDYPADHFDMVHAIGVMSHLPEHLQIVWFKELLRILRPGGQLYFTARGRSCRALLPPDLQAVFDDHRLVSGGAEQAGTEHCVAFHPPQWVVNTLLPSIGAEVAELAECPMGSPGEDRWLLRKPSVAGRP